MVRKFTLKTWEVDADSLSTDKANKSTTNRKLFSSMWVMPYVYKETQAISHHLARLPPSRPILPCPSSHRLAILCASTPCPWFIFNLTFLYFLFFYCSFSFSPSPIPIIFILVAWIFLPPSQCSYYYSNPTCWPWCFPCLFVFIWPPLRGNLQ